MTLPLPIQPKPLTKEQREEMLQRGHGKLPTPEAMGPALLFLARQTGETCSGQILSADEFGVSWP